MTSTGKEPLLASFLAVLHLSEPGRARTDLPTPTGPSAKAGCRIPQRLDYARGRLHVLTRALILKPPDLLVESEVRFQLHVLRSSQGSEERVIGLADPPTQPYCAKELALGTAQALAVVAQRVARAATPFRIDKMQVDTFGSALRALKPRPRSPKSTRRPGNNDLLTRGVGPQKHDHRLLDQVDRPGSPAVRHVPVHLRHPRLELAANDASTLEFMDRNLRRGLDTIPSRV